MSEEAVLKIERAAFMRLVRTPGTLARVEHMLETGKPLRNESRWICKDGHLRRAARRHPLPALRAAQLRGAGDRAARLRGGDPRAGRRRAGGGRPLLRERAAAAEPLGRRGRLQLREDRKSTRLNSSHYCASRMTSSD